MAMLAEGKKKQKWSQDPRNKTWSTDTDRFGYQMLTKMGWSDGKGLGASESGTTSHVKISLKNDNLGVGAKTSHDDNWLAHQDDFNSLLAHLNSANNTGNASEDQSSNDMESIARKSKKRVFYERFIKSKNTSSYSATDMACIMGKRSKSAPDTPVDKSEDEDSDGSCASCPALQETNSLGLTTINSSQSVQEYFAMKMAELKKKRQRQSTEESTLEKSTEDKEEELNCNLESNQADKTKKKRKQKREKNDKKEKKNTEGNSDESSSCCDEKGNENNKKKKDKKRKREENEEVQEEVVEKKRKKKSKAEYNDSLEEEKNSKKGKKKDKKVKDEQIETDSTTITDNSEERSSKRAKKSKTKEKDIEEISKSKNDKKSKKSKKQASNEKFCEDGKSNESSKKKSKNKDKRKKI